MDLYCDCGLILVRAESLLDGRCIDCRGHHEGELGWYGRELQARARERVAVEMARADRLTAMARRVYGKEGKPRFNLPACVRMGGMVAEC